MKLVGHKNNTIFSGAVFLFSCLFMLIVIGTPSSDLNSNILETHKSSLKLPAFGAWNGFNNHYIVLECLNLVSIDSQYSINIFDQENSLIGQEIISIDRLGVVHTILNKYKVQNSYGTIEISNVDDGLPQLHCNIVTYKISEDGTDEVEYATSMLVGKTLAGKTYGVANSMNPQQGTDVPVQNWLSVYNSGDLPFSATIRVRNLLGEIIEDEAHRIEMLDSGSRVDIQLLASVGQGLGQYVIEPDNTSQEYGAFLSRYGQDTNSKKFNFSIVFQSSSGLVNSGLLPVSTMGPAIDWAEIINIEPYPIDVKLEIFSSDSLLLKSLVVTLPAFSQYHEYLNQYIGEYNVGSFRAQSLNNGKMLVQSLYYGHPPDNLDQISWAYGSMAKGAISYVNSAEIPINTYLDAPNWIKLLNASTDPIDIALEITSDTGESISLSQDVFSLVGTIDIPLHTEVGPNFIGKAVVKSINQDNLFGIEAIRVYSEAPALNTVDSKSGSAGANARSLNNAIGTILALALPGSATSETLTHKECNINGSCENIDGAGSNQCEDFNDCFHRECDHIGFCTKTIGSGADQCNKDSECVHKDCGESGTGGFCQNVVGKGSDRCTNNNDCLHFGCAGVFCRTLAGPGDDQCSDNSECRHKGCNADGACTYLPDGGKDECSDNSECGHKECSLSGYCIQVSGIGKDSCSKNDECGYQTCNEDSACERHVGKGESNCVSYKDCRHRECKAGFCKEMSGAGKNECTYNRECGHKACSEDGTCSRVEGVGKDECSEDFNCKHRECAADGTCKEVPGAGSDQCFRSAECSHKDCNTSSGYCEAFPGKGEDICTENSECGHRVCTTLSGLCAQAPGEGKDECSETDDCRYKKCDNRNYCTSAVGTLDDECSEHSECGHQECRDGICRQVAGRGKDQCSVTTICGHNECSDSGFCSLVAGAGKDQCSTNLECRSESPNSAISEIPYPTISESP